MYMNNLSYDKFWMIDLYLSIYNFTVGSGLHINISLQQASNEVEI